VKRVLFVCTVNRMRSATAEEIFRDRADWEVRSAGTHASARTPVTAELVAWAEQIFVMEPEHRRELLRRFGAAVAERTTCLDIPDRYLFMDPVLVGLLKAKVGAVLEPPETEAASGLAETFQLPSSSGLA
jgi:predicted protein tyrosine phosphatase